MSLLGDIGSGIGSFISDWSKPLALAGAGLGVYESLRAQQARDRQAQQYQDAQNQAYQSALSAYQAGPPAPVVIPALSAAAAAKAKKVYQQYYGQSLDLYKPYVDSASRLYPQEEALYSKVGLPGLSALADANLSPEAMAKTNTGGPAYSVPLEIPRYLAGGK